MITKALKPKTNLKSTQKQEEGKRFRTGETRRLNDEKMPGDLFF